MRLFRHVESRNNEFIVKKTGEILSKRSRGLGRSKKKLVDVIRVGMRTCGVVENIPLASGVHGSLQSLRRPWL